MANAPTMFEEFDYTGKWRLPGQTEGGWTGIVSFKPETGSALKLLDAPDYPKSPKVLFGEVSDSPYRLMLLNCYRVGHSPVFTRQSRSENQLYQARYLLAGHWSMSSDDEDLTFTSLGVSFSCLRGWMWSGSPFRRERDGGEGQEASVSYRRDRVLQNYEVYEHEPCEMEILLNEGIGESRDTASLQLSRENYIRLVPLNPQSLDWFMEQIQRIQDLLSFLIGLPIERKKISGTMKEDDPRPGTADVYHFVRPPKEDEIHNRKMALPLELLGELMPDVIEAWYEKDEEQLIPFKLCLDVINNEQKYSKFEFLALVHSLESFHRYKYGKNPGLQDRLKKLRKSLPKLLQNDLALDDEFLKSVDSSRDYFSHYDPEIRKRRNVLEGLDLYNAIARLVPFAAFILYHELGIPEGKICEAFKRMEYGGGLWQRPQLQPLREMDEEWPID